MPTYSIVGPDGKTYSIEGPAGATRAEVIAAIERRRGGAQTQEKSGFFNSIVEGAKTIFSGDEAAKFAAASPEERDSLRKKFLASTQGDTQGIGLSDVDNIPEFWQWLRQTAGQSLGAMAVPAAAGFASKLAGAPNPMARAVGYTAMGVQYVIDNLARQAQEQDAAIAEGREVPKTDVGKAIIGASAQTGLDVGVMELAFKPLLTRFPIVKALFEGGELATKRNVSQLAQALKSGQLKVSNGLVKGALFGAAVEAPQELVQTLIERWQAGLPLADAEAKKEYFEAAVGGGILGGGFGAGQKAMVNQGEIGLARDELARQDAELKAQEEERAKTIQEQEDAAEAAAQPVTPPVAPPPATAPGVRPATTAPGTRTTTGTKPVAQGYLGGVDPTAAADFVKNLATQNNGAETRVNEWRDALMAQFNLSEENADSLMGVLHGNKVLSRKFGKAQNGRLLNKLYEPTLTDQRKDYLAKLDPEIRRVADIASEEDKTLLNSLITKITPSLDKNGKVVRLKADTVSTLFKSMDDLLAKYKAPEVAPTTAEEPVAAAEEPVAAAEEPVAAAEEPVAAAEEPIAAAEEPVAAAEEPVAVVEDTRSDEDKVIEAFKSAGKVNTSIIRDTLGLDNVKAIAFMQGLLKAGLIEKVGNSNRYRFPVPKPEENAAGAGENVEEGTEEGTEEENGPSPFPPRRADESLEDYMDRYGEWAARRSPEDKKRDAEYRLKEAKRESNALNKNPEFTAPDQGITYRYINGGLGVEAYNDKNQPIGSVTTENGDDVSNIEVSEAYRKKGIAENLFDRLRRVHGTLGFSKSVFNEQGAKFATRLYVARKYADNAVHVPEAIRQAGDQIILKRKGQEVYKEILKHALANNGAIPAPNVLENQLNMTREEVGHGYVALAKDGYIEPATQTETDRNGKKFTRQLNYFVATQKLRDAVAEAQAKRLEAERKKQIESVPEEAVEEVPADQLAAEFREGFLQFLNEKPRTEEDIKAEYEENITEAIDVLTDLLQKGEVVKDGDKYRLKTAEKPAVKPAVKPTEPPKTSTDFKIVMQKRGVIASLLKKLAEADVPGYSVEENKAFLANAMKNVTKLDEYIAELQADVNDYNAGVSDYLSNVEVKDNNKVTEKTKAAEQELAGKPVDNYISYVIRHGNMFQKVLAARIMLAINAMRKDGYNVDTEVVNASNYQKRYGVALQKYSTVAAVVNGQVELFPATRNYMVSFTSNSMKFTGFTPETILHELLHVVTVHGYHIGRVYKNKATHPVWYNAVTSISKLYNHVRAEIDKLKDAGKLTAEEEYLVAKTNFLADPKELMAWGQTNDTAKRLLEKIQYGTNERGKPRTAWDAFVSIMRRMLGLPASADTALSELMHLTTEFMTLDRTAYQTAGSGSVTSPMSIKNQSAQAPVPPAANTQNVYVAKPIHAGGFDDTTKRLSQQEAIRLDPRKGIRETLGNLFSQNKWERIVTNFQNERRPLKRLSDLLDAAGLLDVFDRVNDLYGEITRSMAMSENILNETMWRHMVDVDKAVLELSEATGKTKDVVLAELQQYVMGRHEPERRKAFYEMFVPLNNRVNTTLDAKLLKNIMVIPRDEDGKPIKRATAVSLASISAPPARLRQIIMAELNQNQDLVSNGYAEAMRSALSELVERNNKQNVDGTVDGFSPMLGKKGVRLSTDINDRVYDVIGAYSRNQIDEMQARYKAALADPKTGPILKRMLDPKTGSVALLQKATIAADKTSNYWSNPVDNRKAFYGWDYYVPLKGSPETSAASVALDELNFQGERLGAGFNDVQGEMGGRENDAENPILRTLVDATKSAIRYGRKGTMEAIGNLIDKDPRTDKQYIKGKKVGNIPFDQRMNMIGDKKFSGPDKFFVYRANGSIDVYEISDKTMKEAIRRTFSAPNKLVDMANMVTSGIGHLHTRYNVAFHPYNFVRDALTNAFTLGAEFGPAMSAKLLKAVATRVSESGMLLKAAKISKLYTDGKLDEIERMAKAGDTFAADALRYFKRGGRVTRLSGTDIREQGERMMRDVRRGNLARSKEMLDSVVDNWADSFELTSRLATFGVLRNYYTSKGMTEQEAEIRATTYAKNLANFEQVGRYGRTAGALFMFFRPAATGAVRAIDALMPAFQSWESYKKNIPEDILGEPNGAAYKKIEKEFLARKKSAQGMMMALAGAGAMLWTMAWMMADDDEIGRNRVATDKLSLWTRNARLPLSFLGEKYKDSYFQIPWGFGVGAFGAIGAQVAGVAGGYTTMGEAIPNLITIGLDSYMPVPVSRIDPTENFAAFAASSFFPSAGRPLIEYAMNVDGLGREIYNDRQTRYGDAFTGGRNTPQLWKDAARTLFNVSGGEWDVDPDTMLFFANNYLDGATRIAQSGYGLSLSMSGEKNFSLKEDFAPLSSFVGRASNYDGEKFAELEQHMRELNQRIRSLERDPDLYREYIQNNYTEYQAVQMFNRDSNGWLRKLRQMRNQIEASNNLSPKAKEERLRGVYLATGYIKRGLLARAKDGGISL